MKYLVIRIEPENFININDILDKNQQYYHNKEDGYLYKIGNKKRIIYCGKVVNPIILSNYNIS